MSSHEQIDAFGQAAQMASASAADSSSAGGSSPWPSAAHLSPAQRCHLDSLTGVLGYFKLRELPTIMQTCRAWLAAAGKEKARGLTLQLRLDQISQLCTSASLLRRHISGLVCRPFESMRLGQLRALQSLPSLVSLDVALKAADIATATGQRDLRAALPPRLRSFTLKAPPSRDTSSLQTVIAALPTLHSLQTLTLHSRQHAINESLSVEPLLHLPRLTELCLDLQLSPAQLEVIKQIGSLQKLNINQGRWMVQGLHALGSPPHRLQQLEEIDLSATEVGVGHMNELAQLPGLTTLKPALLAPSAVTLLPRLQRLHTIRLDPELFRDADNLPQLCTALRQCPSVTTLVLELYREHDGDRLPDLLAAVAGLRVLQIEQSTLRSLRFLRRAPHLEELHLLKCKEVRPMHLLGAAALLPQLRVLRVHDCSGVCLDEWELELLTPPGSALLPNLRSFDYSPGAEIRRVVYVQSSRHSYGDYDYEDPFGEDVSV